MAEFIKLEKEDKKERKIIKRKFSFKKFFLIVLIFFLLSSIISSISYSMSSKIAVVPISGPILTEKTSSILGSSGVSSREISQNLREIARDDSIKAVIIDINSPGGSPVASQEISNAIEKLKMTKPVYALINDIGASGAFWVAVSTNKIYASSMSTIGSIGVTSATLGFENLIKNYNITYRQLTAGEIKDIGSPFKEPTKKEEKIIQNMLDTIHKKFISHVANSRNLNYSYVEKYATGEIFLGDKAKEIGFIDKIGYYPDVISDLKKEINQTTEILIVDYSPKLTFFEQLGFRAFSQFTPKLNSNKIMLE